MDHLKCSRLKSVLTLCALFVFLMVMASPTLASAPPPTRIIFLHHSCGHNLIEQGGVRGGLTALGYEFYDHGYNDDGLRLADGSYTGSNFDVPGDNTDPDGIAEIFAQPLHDPPDNTFSRLMQYDVIAFKSCFPTSNIGDDYQLNEYKSYYLSVRNRMDQHPDKIFIVVTQPPQVPGDSNLDEARRARALANWLTSNEYLAGHPNVSTFDFFGYLAGDDNFLRPEYRFDDYDAHPNERANGEIGPHFVTFIHQAIQGYQSGAPRATAAPPPTEAAEALPTSTPTEVAEAEEAEEVEAQPVADAAPSMASGVIDDFESGKTWGSDAETGSTIACNLDTSAAYGGANALHIHYKVASGGWGDCGRHFDDGPHNWDGSTGLTFWLRAEGAPEWVTLMLFSGNPDNPTPFEVGFEITGGEWTQLVFPWTDFARAGWADASGLTEIDPTRITGYGFSLGTGEGEVWIDDVILLTGEMPKPEPTTPAQPDESGDESVAEEAVESEPVAEEAVEEEPIETQPAVEEPIEEEPVAEEPIEEEPVIEEEPLEPEPIEEEPAESEPVADTTGGGPCPSAVAMLSLSVMTGLLVYGRRSHT
jgi:hypothetical protein